MTAPEGYFYSALDADSDGHEGTFYVWSEKELADLLGNSPEAKAFRKAYALEKPNFEEKSFILRLEKPLSEEEKKTFAPFKKKLFESRAKRSRPFLDTKLITAWNGQMIAAYAGAGRALEEQKYLDAATKASEFLLKNMRQKDGRLFRIYSAPPGGKPTAQGTAFLDDYAYLIDGFNYLHMVSKEKRWLAESEKLQELQDKHYGDEKRGAYFTTPHDGEKLFARSKDSYDGAQPSGNGLSTYNLVVLYSLTKKQGYLAQAEKNLRAYTPTLKGNPSGVPIMVCTLDEILQLGGFTEEPTAKEEPKKPLDSADVLEVSLSRLAVENGIESFTIRIIIKDGWHIYANPVENKILLESATQIELLIDGKPAAKADFEYPKGELKKEKDGDYRTYEGKIGIVIKLNHADTKDAKTITARVKVVACNDKTCLKPSTIKVDAK
jgi:uncharacterized protein YyaL (SSP411 family)